MHKIRRRHEFFASSVIAEESYRAMSSCHVIQTTDASADQHKNDEPQTMEECGRGRGKVEAMPTCWLTDRRTEPG